MRSLAGPFGLLALLGVSSLWSQTNPDVRLATTTSVRDAGLLDYLLPEFERATGARVRVIAVGSGQAMALARRGEADVLLAHDPEGERRFVADGFGLSRTPIMQNEFMLVGPPVDVARVRGLEVRAALRRIAEAGAVFASRDDRSGTHAREMALWESLAIRPSGPWYRQTGQGMSATLQIAHEIGAYTLTDVGTYLTRRDDVDLEVLVSGDSALINRYHLVAVNPDRFSWINRQGAMALEAFLTSEETRQRIAGFGVSDFGRSLFEPIR